MRLIRFATIITFSVFLCSCSSQKATAEAEAKTPAKAAVEVAAKSPTKAAVTARPASVKIALNGTADLWGQPIGSAGLLTFTVPNNLAKYKEAVLYIQVDDIDAPEEAVTVLNDKITLSLPKSIYGETGGRSGCIFLNVKDLKPGFNKLAFVFNSTLNGTTSGYAILASELELFEELSDKQKVRIKRESASWGKPVNWNKLKIHDEALKPRVKPDITDYFQDEPLKRWNSLAGSWTVKGGLEIFDVEDRIIYQSPEEPGHVLWSHISKGINNIFQITFTQLTGNPGLETSYRPVHGRNEERWLKTAKENNMPLGPADAVTTTNSVHLRMFSADNGVTWEQKKDTNIKFVRDKGPGGVGSYYTNLRCRDGRLMKNPGPDEYRVLVKDTNGINNLTDAGLSMVLLGVRESLDNGETWSKIDWVTPKGCDPAIVDGSTEEAAMVELDDGRILVIQRVHPRHNGPIQFYLTRVGPGKYEATQPTLLPMAYSGFPELLRASDGTIWYWGHGGHWYTYNDGASWHRLATRFTSYYGRMVEGLGKKLVCTTMNRIGDSPYPHGTDANIRLYRFGWRKTGTINQNDADKRNVLITRNDTALGDLHIKADMRVDGATGLAFRVSPDGKSYHCLIVIMPGSEVYDKWFIPEGEQATQAVDFSAEEERTKGRRSTIKRPMLVIAKVEGEKVTVLRSRSLQQRSGFPKGSWVRLQLKITGDLVQGAINSDPPIYVGTNDIKAGSGGIGLFTDVSTGAFKNIEVWNKPQMIRDNWD